MKITKHEKNYLVLEHEDKEYCFSYKTLVGVKTDDTWFIDPKNYSVTTNRHLKEFFGLSLQERRKALEDGEYTYFTVKNIKEFEDEI